MYAFIAAYKLYITNGGSGSATSLTDFLTWFNGIRNALTQEQQIYIDLLSNSAYATFRNKSSAVIQEAVHGLEFIDNVDNYTDPANTATAYPTTVSGSTVMATAFIKAELAMFDKVINENGQSSNSQVNTLQTLL
jgi:hypothetical protein